jgi:hypothetical protein
LRYATVERKARLKSGREIVLSYVVAKNVQHNARPKLDLEDEIALAFRSPVVGRTNLRVRTTMIL